MIIDLTTMVSGPLATMMLADQGADVIKIESPGGDHSRQVATRRGGFSASFLNNNRNKRSVVLDLKRAEGVAALKRLCTGADVFIQNFRPGVAERLGVGEDAVRSVNPGIIYTSICGFGFDGPYAQKSVFDPLVQAASSLTTVQAGSDERRPRLIQDAVKPFTTRDVLDRLEAHDVPCAPVLTRREMTRDPQVAANGIIVETAHPDAGRSKAGRRCAAP